MKRNHPPQKQLNILACDPSLTAWGYAVLDTHGTILDCGCIKTQPTSKKQRIRKGDDRVRRITEINHVLLGLIRKYDIKYIVSELPHGSQSAVSAVMIGITAGIMQTIADTLDIGIEWYSEQDAKKNLLGKKSATKQEIIDAIALVYGIDWKKKVGYIDEAVADALAIHLLASTNSSTLKLFKQ